jgi:phosphoribosylglycinamide formyltransferase-1
MSLGQDFGYVNKPNYGLKDTFEEKDVKATRDYSESSPRIAVFVSGGGTNLQALIDAVSSGEIEARIVLVLADRPGCFAMERAANHGIHTVLVDRKTGTSETRESIILEALDSAHVDWVVLAGFLGILSEGLVRRYQNRIINIHPALIPKYCGKGYYGEHVHEAVLASGDTITGVTVHLVDEGVDTGKILLQRTVSVLPGDTVETLYDRLRPVEHRALVDAVKALVSEDYGRNTK